MTMSPTSARGTPRARVSDEGDVVDDGGGGGDGGGGDVEVDGPACDSSETMTSAPSSAYPPLHPAPAPAPAPGTSAATGAPSSSSASALIISASDKAGMDGVDRDAIDRIILRESGDSAYMRQQRKRDEAVNEKIETMRRRLEAKDSSDPNWRSRAEGELAPRIRELIDESESKSESSGVGCDGVGGGGTNPRRWSTAVVVDMDSFFISCELLDKPELRDVPCCVGSIRSIISTSNYAARRYGVRSAMAGFIGDKLVKELSGGKQTLRFLRSNFGLYKDKSRSVREVLAQYDPNLRSYSLDEAYMDLGPYFDLRIGRGWSHDRIQSHWAPASRRREAARSDDEGGEADDGDGGRGGTGGGCEEGESPTTGEDTAGARDGGGDDDDGPSQHPRPAPSPEDVVAEMRASVHSATGLTCSAGIAPNHMLAKIASDINKPNGQLLVPPNRGGVMNFIRPLKVRKVPGIGRVAEKTLQAFGIFTVGDLYDHRAVVKFLFPPASAGSLLRASLGLGSSSSTADDDGTEDGDGDMSEESRQKGISRERTFGPGKSWAELNDILETISRKLADDMSSKDLRGRTVTLKVKLHTFDVLTRCRSLPVGTYYRTAGDLVPVAAELFAEARRNHHREQSGTAVRGCGGAGRRFDVRLLGVRCSNLLTREEEAASAGQMSLSRFLSRPAAATTAKDSSVCITGDHRHHGDGAMVDLTNDTPSATDSRRRTTEERASLETQKLGGYRSRDSPKEPRDGGNDDDDDRRDSVPHRSGGGDDEDETTGACGPPEAVRCPVCDRALHDVDNVELNRHVDACLSGRAIRELVRGEEGADAADAVADSSRSRTTVPTYDGAPSLEVAAAFSAGRGVPPKKAEKRLLTDFFADSRAAKRLAS